MPEDRDEADEKPPPGKYFVSPSQLKLFLFGCERKWGFTYILKLRAPSGRGAALGTRVHNQLEKYLRDGKQLDFTEMDEHGVYPAEIAATGLQHLPAPQSHGLKIEGYFKFQVPECPSVIFRGYKDYTCTPEVRTDGLPHVGDHKTCGNWEYALSADDLKGDIQAIIYAKHELLKYPDAPAVTLQWGYLGTKKKYVAHPVRATITRADVATVWPEIVLGANRLVTTFGSGKQPLELPFNNDECDKYSREGCPFKSTCKLSPEERRPFYMSSAPTSNLLDRIKARQAAETGVPATALAAAPAAGLSLIQAKLAAAKAAKAATPPPAPTEVTESTASATLPVTPASESSAYAPGCEPTAPAEIPAVFRQPPALPASDQPINCPTDFQPAPKTIGENEAADKAAVEAIVPPAPKHAGRPPGSKNKSSVAVAPAIDDELVGLFKAALKKYLGEAA